MFDQGLLAVLKYAFLCGVGGSIVGAVLNQLSRGDTRLRLDYALAVGFLVGAAIGSVVGIFASMMSRL
ncbi:MAG: hypothetical protein AAF961_13820 [Planctomycetota bacterium]